MNRIVTEDERKFRILDIRDGTFVVQEEFMFGWRNMALCDNLDAAEKFVEEESAKTPRIVKEYP